MLNLVIIILISSSLILSGYLFKVVNSERLKGVGNAIVKKIERLDYIIQSKETKIKHLSNAYENKKKKVTSMSVQIKKLKKTNKRLEEILGNKTQSIKEEINYLVKYIEHVQEEEDFGSLESVRQRLYQLSLRL